MADEELYNSAGMGRWSFSLQSQLTTFPNTQAAQPLFSLQGIEPAEARMWTVNLNRFHYTGGQPSAFAINGTTDNATNVQAQIFLDISWGVDGSLEQAQIDWPAGGGSFQLNAAMIRANVNWPNQLIAPAPLLSGWISPGEKLSTLAQLPYRTNRFGFLGAAGQVTLARPPRAVAFRLNFVNDVAAGTTLRVDQVTETSAFVTKSDGVFNTAPGSQDMAAQNQAMYYPITSLTQAIQITNIGANSVSQLAIQFLLDLG